MKLPRLTTRRLMLLVGLAAIALGLAGWMHRRAEGFRAEAARHIELWLVWAPDGTDATRTHKATHHWALAEKYEQAARNPWLSVEPDPPEPE